MGIVTTTTAAHAVADPLRDVRAGLGAGRGTATQTSTCRSTTRSEVGLLQAGFNQMAAGLRERERMRDLFGRHVGEDVARQALEGDIELGGELRDAAALFVDIVGSTQLAARRRPSEVVELLNDFFAIVVEVVEAARRLGQQVRGRRRALRLRRADRHDDAARLTRWRAARELRRPPRGERRPARGGHRRLRRRGGRRQRRAPQPASSTR